MQVGRDLPEKVVCLFVGEVAQADDLTNLPRREELSELCPQCQSPVGDGCLSCSRHKPLLGYPILSVSIERVLDRQFKAGLPVPDLE